MIDRDKAYGVSSKYNGRFWDHDVYGPFHSDEEATRWLHHQEGGFRERELMNKSAAIKLAGEGKFKWAKENLEYFLKEVETR